HSTVQNEVGRLRRLERAHQRNENMLIHTRRDGEYAAERATADITGLEAALPKLTDTGGDRFRIQLHDRTYTSRVDAGAALARWANNSDLKWAPRYTSRDYGVVGQISGFPIHLALRPGYEGANIDITLDDVPRSTFTIARDTLLEGGVGLIQRIENRVSGIPALLDHARDDLATAQQTIADAAQRIGQPFRHADALRDAERHLTDVEAQLAELNHDQDEEPGVPEPPTPPIEERVTVETLHERRDPPTRPTPRPEPPTFIRAGHDADQPRPATGMSW
ncbi:MAG: helicase, partial [Solirubrobacteraceae bacterium]